MPHPPVQLDGRILEGGGQIVRIAVGLSALTDIPIRITNIRGNRAGGGGLKRQHLASVDFLSQACNATTRGAYLQSTSLDFTPGNLVPGSPVYHRVEGTSNNPSFWECKFDTRTGSTALGLQAILPFIIFEPPRNDDATLSDLPVRLTISGGINVDKSPSYEYITQVLLPTLHNIGLPRITSTLHERGKGHRGKGSFTLEIPARPSLDLPAFSLHPGTSTSLRRPQRLDATFIAPTAAHALLNDIFLPTITEFFGEGYSVADNNLSLTLHNSPQLRRYYLIIVATVCSSSDDPAAPRTYKLGRDSSYTGCRSAQRVAGELVNSVCQELNAEWISGAYVDEYMRDQLVVFQALAKGTCRVYGGNTAEGELREASLHARTAEWVCEQMNNAD